MQLERSAVFIINLVQDVNVLRPLIFMAARDFGFRTSILVSAKFGARDQTGTWYDELRQIAGETGARIKLFEDDFEARDHLTGVGLLFSASESHLQDHATTHGIFRYAPPGFLKVTVQHGFECVGFRHGENHVRAHGPTASFGADLICAWHHANGLTALAPSQLGKLIVTGPTSLLQAGSDAAAASDAVTAGLVCENLHSVRFTSPGPARSEFIETFWKFSRSMARRDRRIVLRPHAGGQYFRQKKIELPANVEIDDAPLYRLDLRKFAYGVSAPSSVIIDMLLADIPTAVWRDSAGDIDASNYEGLTTVSSASEWTDFARTAEGDPQSFLTVQNAFLRRQQMPLDPGEVFSRFAALFEAAKRMEVRPSGSAFERERILLVANSNLPTVQLSFDKPLAPLVGRGEIDMTLLTERQLRDLGSTEKLDTAADDRIQRQLDWLSPSVVVFCRYSGPGYAPILAWARREGVPVIYHIDDDLLGVPAAIGERKFAVHNAPERLQAVTELLNAADLVYASTEALKRRLLEYFPHLPVIAGEIYCASRVLRRPQPHATCRIGYMASADHSHNLQPVLPAIERMLDRNSHVEVEFFGSIPVPAELRRFGDRITTTERIADYEEFLRAFAEREWDVGICPLVPIPFNLTKADTKWVEYTAAGVAVIASRGTVYDHCCAEGCGILADTAEDWFSALDLLANNVDERVAMVNRAQAKLGNQYTLTRLREQVLNVMARSHDAVRARARNMQDHKEQHICQTQ